MWWDRRALRTLSYPFRVHAKWLLLLMQRGPLSGDHYVQAAAAERCLHSMFAPRFASAIAEALCRDHEDLTKYRWLFSG